MDLYDNPDKMIDVEPNIEDKTYHDEQIEEDKKDTRFMILCFTLIVAIAVVVILVAIILLFLSIFLPIYFKREL